MDPVDRLQQESSLSDDVYRSLKEYILNEVSRPPDRLQIGQLARHFGVSITPIREALIRLAAEHIVDLKPGRGFFFKEFMPGEQINLYDLLYFGLRYSLDRQGRKTLRLLPRSSLPALPVDQWPLAMALAHEELYARIAASCGNEQALDLVRNLSERTRSSRILFFEQHGANTKPLEDLRKLDALLHAGETQAALELLRQQFETTKVNMNALAAERLRRIYDVYPMLRPSSTPQFR